MGGPVTLNLLNIDAAPGDLRVDVTPPTIRVKMVIVQIKFEKAEGLGSIPAKAPRFDKNNCRHDPRSRRWNKSQPS